VLDSVKGLEVRRARLRDRRDDPKALHTFRKQARRVAAQAQLVELYLKPTEHSKVLAVAARPARGLGPFRDADVLGKRLAALARGKSAAVRDELEALHKALEPSGRKAAAAKAVRRAGPRHLRKPLEDLLGRMQPRGAEPLAVIEARLRLRGRLATAPGAPLADLHAFRLELKAYRYAREAVVPAGVRDRVGEQARQVTDLLGGISDAALLGRAAAQATPRAARMVVAAAGRDDRAARKAFETGWAQLRWPALQERVRAEGP
jgi:CHAD domain-containing protein